MSKSLVFPITFIVRVVIFDNTFSCSNKVPLEYALTGISQQYRACFIFLQNYLYMSETKKNLSPEYF